MLVVLAAFARSKPMSSLSHDVGSVRKVGTSGLCQVLCCAFFIITIYYYFHNKNEYNNNITFLYYEKKCKK